MDPFRLIFAVTVWSAVATGAAASAEPTTASSLDFARPGERRVPYHGRFDKLPVGAIRPRGWIRAWLDRQAAGMTGHPEHLGYPYDTTMFAGKIPPPAFKHGEDWWAYEQSGYFVDAATRLHALTGGADVAGPSLDYIVAHSGLGRLGESTWGWPNAVVGRALLARYDATGDAAVIRALADCVLGTRGVGGRDGLLAEEALRLYGLSGDDRFLAFARRAYDRYFVGDPKSFSTVEKINGPKPLREHGVTAAEQLKLLPMLYSYTGDADVLKLADAAYRKVEADSLMPDGGIVSSESLGTAAFNSLHETCDVVDWSWSMGYQLLASGDGRWADRIEHATFNALPGATSKDFKQVQYFSSPNQVIASRASNVRLAPTRMWYRPSHETECCTGNVNRAMPNYVTRMWARTADGAAALLFGPCEVTLDLNGQRVVIAEETDYPFRETITFTVHAAGPVTFAWAHRVPAWCDRPAVTINGAPVADVALSDGFATLRREFEDGDVVALRLPMRVRSHDWYGGRAASVERGPLVFSLPVEPTPVVSDADAPAMVRAMKGNALRGFAGIEFFPAGEWRYGLDAGSMTTNDAFVASELPIADNPFDPRTPGVRIAATLRPLPQWEAGWSAAPGEAQANPKTSTKNVAALPDDAALASAGQRTGVTLVPLGATYLRLTTFPLIPTTRPARP